ncbi:hypothetical protein MIDIC_460017 [Alphaproteobacteria bacterium]
MADHKSEFIEALAFFTKNQKIEDAIKQMGANLYKFQTEHPERKLSMFGFVFQNWTPIFNILREILLHPVQAFRLFSFIINERSQIDSTLIERIVKETNMVDFVKKLSISDANAQTPKILTGFLGYFANLPENAPGKLLDMGVIKKLASVIENDSTRASLMTAVSELLHAQNKKVSILPALQKLLNFASQTPAVLEILQSKKDVIIAQVKDSLFEQKNAEAVSRGEAKEAVFGLSNLGQTLGKFGIILGADNKPLSPEALAALEFKAPLVTVDGKPTIGPTPLHEQLNEQVQQKLNTKLVDEAVPVILGDKEGKILEKAAGIVGSLGSGKPLFTWTTQALELLQSNEALGNVFKKNREAATEAIKCTAGAVAQDVLDKLHFDARILNIVGALLADDKNIDLARQWTAALSNGDMTQVANISLQLIQGNPETQTLLQNPDFAEHLSKFVLNLVTDMPALKDTLGQLPGIQQNMEALVKIVLPAMLTNISQDGLGPFFQFIAKKLTDADRLSKVTQALESYPGFKDLDPKVRKEKIDECLSNIRPYTEETQQAVDYADKYNEAQTLLAHLRNAVPTALLDDKLTQMLSDYAKTGTVNISDNADAKRAVLALLSRASEGVVDFAAKLHTEQSLFNKLQTEPNNEAFAQQLEKQKDLDKDSVYRLEQMFRSSPSQQKKQPGMGDSIGKVTSDMLQDQKTKFLLMQLISGIVENKEEFKVITDKIVAHNGDIMELAPDVIDLVFNEKSMRAIRANPKVFTDMITSYLDAALSNSAVLKEVIAQIPVQKLLTNLDPQHLKEFLKETISLYSDPTKSKFSKITGIIGLTYSALRKGPIASPELGLSGEVSAEVFTGVIQSLRERYGLGVSSISNIFKDAKIVGEIPDFIDLSGFNLTGADFKGVVFKAGCNISGVTGLNAAEIVVGDHGKIVNDLYYSMAVDISRRLFGDSTNDGRIQDTNTINEFLNTIFAQLSKEEVQRIQQLSTEQREAFLGSITGGGLVKMLHDNATSYTAAGDIGLVANKLALGMLNKGQHGIQLNNEKLEAAKPIITNFLQQCAKFENLEHYKLANDLAQEAAVSLFGEDFKSNAGRVEDAAKIQEFLLKTLSELDPKQLNAIQQLYTKQREVFLGGITSGGLVGMLHANAISYTVAGDIGLVANKLALGMLNKGQHGIQLNNEKLEAAKPIITNFLQQCAKFENLEHYKLANDLAQEAAVSLFGEDFKSNAGRVEDAAKIQEFLLKTLSELDPKQLNAIQQLYTKQREVFLGGITSGGLVGMLHANAISYTVAGDIGLVANKLSLGLANKGQHGIQFSSKKLEAAKPAITNFLQQCAKFENIEDYKLANALAEDVAKGLFGENFKSNAGRVEDAAKIQEFLLKTLNELDPKQLKTLKTFYEQNPEVVIGQSKESGLANLFYAHATQYTKLGNISGGIELAPKKMNTPAFVKAVEAHVSSLAIDEQVQKKISEIAEKIIVEIATREKGVVTGERAEMLKRNIKNAFIALGPEGIKSLNHPNTAAKLTQKTPTHLGLWGGKDNPFLACCLEASVKSGSKPFIKALAETGVSQQPSLAR